MSTTTDPTPEQVKADAGAERNSLILAAFARHMDRIKDAARMLEDDLANADRVHRLRLGQD